jgi:hypothetical protein
MTIVKRALCLTLALFSLTLAADKAETRAALDRLKSDVPQLKIYSEQGRIARLYGAPFSGGTNAENSAEAFRINHAAALGVAPQNLIAESLTPDRRQTQPVMYNPVTGRSKFTLVYYTQYFDGIPVFRSDLRLLVRNGADYPVVEAASALHDLGEYTIDPALSAIDKSRITSSFHDPDFPDMARISESRKVIWAGMDEESAQPRLAVEITADNGDPVSERWLYVVDIASGDILYKENRLIEEDISGNVAGKATQGSGAEQCEDEVIVGLPYALVSVTGGNSAYADTSGNFIVPNAGTDQVVVQSWIRGQWFRVYNYIGTDAELLQNVTPPGPAFFVHNADNTDETMRAQVNAYVRANLIRDFVLSYNPSYPELQINEFPIYVNRTDGYCPGNAWYDPGDVSLNFCLSGGGYPNTAWSSVLYHEYGHHLVEAAGSGQDAYGEGTGDVMSTLMTDESGTGFGFYGDCSTPLRDADNTMQYPCSGEIHECGQLMSGCVWSLRNELLAKYPSTYRDTLANLAINAILLHTGGNITPAIAIDYLTLDDDDANIDNGTPNYDAICAAFGAHNMDCPEVVLLSFSYPDGKPETVTPNDPSTFRVVINGVSSTPLEGSAAVYYSLNGGSYVPGQIDELSANEYQITFSGASCFDKIDWYVTAQTSSMDTISDPADAPAVHYTLLVASGTQVEFDDNFQTDMGWTVQDFGGLTDGTWTRGVPVGGGDRGDPASDFDGSGSCFLTDNTDGNSDVDDGTTSLISPTLDLSAGAATISYARWYSNTAGSDPYNDVMEIFVSNDDGADWTLVETVGPVDQANGGWYQHSFLVSDFVEPTATVKLRFDASDRGAGSVVEAGVDDVTVTLFTCEPSYLCGDANGDELVNISDAVALIGYIFGGHVAPEPLAAGDANCDGIVNVSDAVSLVGYIFGGGPAPCSTCD